jgi:hypothetical protein
MVREIPPEILEQAIGIVLPLRAGRCSYCRREVPEVVPFYNVADGRIKSYCSRDHWKHLGEQSEDAEAEFLPTNGDPMST